MKILLIYYTGTYNTRYLASLIEDKFFSLGHQVDKLEVDIDTKSIDLSNYDLIGFGYPIYAFNSPILFNKYIKKLIFIKDKKYFIFKQSGEVMSLNNASSRYIIKRLRIYGCFLENEYHFVMPYNIHFRYEDSFVKELLLYNDKLLEIMTYEILNNINSKIKSNILIKLNSLIFTVQRLGAKWNHLVYKVDSKKCIKCNLCVNKCPTHNISIKNGKYVFHNNCQMCMRCSFNCPKDAIKIGLLEGWKVNGPYNFKVIKTNERINSDFINQNSKGFYRCFVKYYATIDEKYNNYKKIW